MTVPYGLLDQSAVARLLAQMQGVTNPQLPAPTPINPNARPDLSAHTEKGGVRGSILHLLGADRIDPELGALLTPEQRERVKPGVARTLWGGIVEGRGPKAIAQERAANLMGLEDVKKKRDLTAQQQAMMGQIRQMASTMEPQAAAEFVSRMATTYGLPDFGDIAQAAERMRTPNPMQVPRGSAVRKADGTWEIPSPITPPPTSPVQVKTLKGGKPFTTSIDERTGQVFWELPAVPESTGFGMNRPPTEAESKDYVFAGLMRNAMPDIRKTADSVRPEVITAIRTDPVGISKIALTDDERVFWRAVLEFAAAANRKESGAQITASEVSNTLDRYVDTGFDGPAGSPVRKAKAQARENYMKILERTSSRAEAYYNRTQGEAASSATEGKPMSAAAYREARNAGYTDDEIRAQGYRIPEDG